MKIKENKLTVFNGLLLIKGQWLNFSFAMLASLIILSLDFVLTTSMPRVIEGISLVLIDGDTSKVPLWTLIVTILIILRPVVGWLVNFFQIKVLLIILRNLESDVWNTSNKIYLNEDSYSSEKSANMLISHGRYFLDSYLIPLIRAITDLGSVMVICIGLFIQYPLPLFIFISIIVLLLSIYQMVTQNLLTINGKRLVNSYERIIKLSENGFIIIDSDNNIDEVLDVKKHSSLVLASISQGLKYVIEFCFMFAFGAATLYMAAFAPANFVAFTSTFAYAGIRMLPSFSAILAFYHGKNGAEFAIIELSKHLKR